MGTEHLFAKQQTLIPVGGAKGSFNGEIEILSS